MTLDQVDFVADQPSGWGGEGPFGQIIVIPGSSAFALPRSFQVSSQGVMIIVRIEQVISGIVRRIDVDQLDSSSVAFSEQLEDLEIVAFNDDVSRLAPFHTLFFARKQGSETGRKRESTRTLLTLPIEPEPFVSLVDVISEDLSQCLEVNLPVLNNGRKEPRQRLHIRLGDIAGMLELIVSRDI